MTFLQWFGAIWVTLILAAILIAALLYLDERRKNAAMRIYQSGVEAARLQCKHRLRADAVWFSEDPATMRGVEIASDLIDKASPWEVRDAWRKDREAKKEIEGA